MTGSYVFSKRNTPIKPVSWAYGRGSTTLKTGTLPHKNNGAVSPPIQETTSYRTGGAFNLTEDDDVIPTSRDSAFRKHWLENKARDRQQRGDTGHPFETSKQMVLFNGHRRLSEATGYWYAGPLISDARYHSTRGFTYPTLGGKDLNWYGTTAIAKTAPTNPLSNLATTLGELFTEGIANLDPTGWHKRSQDVYTAYLEGRKANSGKYGKDGFDDIWNQHLGVEFGWNPIVSELHATASALLQASRLCRQFRERGGTRNRRSLVFPTTYEEETLSNPNSVGAVYPVSGSADFDKFFWGNLKTGQITESVRTQLQVRFAGAFLYHVPMGNSFWDKLQRYEQQANFLLGIKLTPETLWDLTPWTWFVDWKSSIGSVLHNLGSFSSDGLVLEYGYVTCIQQATHTCTVSGVRLRSGSLMPPFTTNYITKRMQRVRATPYGFGLNPNGFSTRQKAILISLGLGFVPSEWMG